MNTNLTQPKAESTVNDRSSIVKAREQIIDNDSGDKRPQSQLLYKLSNKNELSDCKAEGDNSALNDSPLETSITQAGQKNTMKREDSANQ